MNTPGRFYAYPVRVMFLSRQLVQPSSPLHHSVLGEKYQQSVHVEEESGMEEHSFTH